MSNDAFKRDFAAVLARAGKKAETLVRKSALEIGSSLIKQSPVDTGRFKGNWQCGIGLINTAIESEASKSGAAAKGRIKTGVSSWKPGMTIFITNSLPYARRLEYGWSQQAPYGMVRLTVAEFRSGVEAAAREIQ